MTSILLIAYVFCCELLKLLKKSKIVVDIYMANEGKSEFYFLENNRIIHLIF